MAEAVAETTRRDFLYVATAAFAGLGATAALVPFSFDRPNESGCFDHCNGRSG
jgi:Ubiquitinol-cytochrome C reductase Fe-S subunit TAT signal